MSFKIFNHLGSFLFLAAAVFLIVTSVSAPVANSFGLMTVNLPDDDKGSSVVFGSFGYCIKDGNDHGGDLCSDRKIGYNPAEVLQNITNVTFGEYEEDTTKALTRVMILHPVCVALSFLSFLVSLTASTVIGSILASALGLLAFLVTGIALISDFVLFAIVRKNINSGNGDNGNAYFSSALWTALIALICLLFASIIVLLACCTNRLAKRRAARKAETFIPVTPAGADIKKKFWQRK